MQILGVVGGQFTTTETVDGEERWPEVERVEVPGKPLLPVFHPGLLQAVPVS